MVAMGRHHSHSSLLADDDVAWPYRLLRRPAESIKAVIQMTIGVMAVGLLFHRVQIQYSDGGLGATLSPRTREELFDTIGYALGLAAGVELAYTLFTSGPDEAIDPLALGLSAALILQLGQVERFEPRQAIAALVYTMALALLFLIKKYLVKIGGDQKKVNSPPGQEGRVTNQSDSDTSDMSPSASKAIDLDAEEAVSDPQRPDQ